MSHALAQGHWPEVEPPPTDLPSDDGDKTESPWHALGALLIVASYVAARGGRRDDFFIGANMFLYYSMRQVRNRDYRGPDAFIVKGVEGTRPRDSWIVWEEDGRYPDVLFELLSPSTEAADLSTKKDLYEQVFHTPEYFCIAPDVQRLLGFRLQGRRYAPIAPDARGFLFSEELGMWLGPWTGPYLGEHRTWPRFYDGDGKLILLPDEAEKRRADALAARVAELEAELSHLRTR